MSVISPPLSVGSVMVTVETVPPRITSTVRVLFSATGVEGRPGGRHRIGDRHERVRLGEAARLVAAERRERHAGAFDGCIILVAAKNQPGTGRGGRQFDRLGLFRRAQERHAAEDFLLLWIVLGIALGGDALADRGDLHVLHDGARGHLVIAAGGYGG